MKKTILLLCALLCVVGTAFAEKATSMGIGYNISKINFANSGKTKTYEINALTLTFDTIMFSRMSLISFFTSSQLSLPKEMTKALDGNSEKIDLKFSLDSDLQFGIGYTFLQGGPFNIFAGMGPALNVGMYNYGNEGYLFKFLIGASGVVKADYYISNNFGFFAGIDYSHYFIPFLLTESDTILTTSSYYPYNTYESNETSDLTDFFESASTLNIRAGLTFKY